MDSKDFMAIVCNIVDPKLTMSEKDVIRLIEEKFTTMDYVKCGTKMKIHKLNDKYKLKEPIEVDIQKRDGCYFGNISWLSAAWADGETVEDVIEELTNDIVESYEDWNEYEDSELGKWILREKRRLNSIIKPRVTKEDFKKLKAVDKMLEKLGKENQKIRKEFDLDKEK